MQAVTEMMCAGLSTGVAAVPTAIILHLAALLQAARAAAVALPLRAAAKALLFVSSK